MIASLRGLIALTVIAAALGVVIAVDRPGSTAPVERALVPGLDVARVDAIELGGGGAPAIALARTGGAWRVTAPSPGPADDAAVADLLGAIAAARWERRAPDAPAWRDTRTVALVTGGARVVLHLGDEVAGADQVWARVDDGPALLAPSWVAHAAARDLAALRRSQLVRARPGEITGVELHGRGADLVTSGAIAVVHTAGGAARVRRELEDHLEAALIALRAASFPSGPPPEAQAGALTIRVLGGAAPDELAERGPCPGRPAERWVDSSAGAVCVADAQLAAVADAARALTAGPGAIDPSPLRRARLAHLAWGERGAQIEISGGGFTISAPGAGVAAPADDAAVRAAVDALTAPAIVEAQPLPAGAPATAPVLIARYADGTVDQLERIDTPTGPALRRSGEPFVLRVAPAALAAIALQPGDLRDRALIAEEPSALASLDAQAGARRGHVARGAVIGEWTGDLDGAAVLAAAETIAHLRAARFVTAGEVGAIRLRLDATFAAPPVAGAAPAHHTIELGAPRPGGCAARIDGAPVVLDDARCQALLAVTPR